MSSLAVAISDAPDADEDPGHRPAPFGRPRAAMRSDVGAVREHNEDAAFVDAHHGLFVVADGVGGHAAGEVASAIAVAVVRQTLIDARAHIAALAASGARYRREGIAALLGETVRTAHHAIRRVARCEPDKSGMSTTLDVVLVVGDEAFVAHVGDSRTYLVRDGLATQLTRDHTVAQVMVQTGKLSRDEILGSPMRSVLVNAVGCRPEVIVDLTCVPLRAGDQLLLCSDGLHDYFSDDELGIRLSWNDPELGLRELVELARARGGHDNITGVLVDGLGVRNHAVDAHGMPPFRSTLSDGVPILCDDYDALSICDETSHEPF